MTQSSFLESRKGRAVLTAFLQTKGEASRKVYKSEITRFFAFYSGELHSLTSAHLSSYQQQLAGLSPRLWRWSRYLRKSLPSSSLTSLPDQAKKSLIFAS